MIIWDLIILQLGRKGVFLFILLATLSQDCTSLLQTIPMKNFKSKLSVLSTIVLIVACDLDSIDKKVSPSDNLTSVAHEVAEFDELDVSHAFKVDVIFSDEVTDLEITANENLHQYIEVQQVGDRLEIGLQRGISVSGNATLRAEIRVGSLNNIRASGASYISMTDTLESDNLTVVLSGASSILGQIYVDQNLFADLSGASYVNFKGYAETMEVEASGASLVKDYDLTIQELYLDLSGASGAYLTVERSIEVEASGGSVLTYKGNPEFGSMDLSGGSTVVKRE